MGDDEVEYKAEYLDTAEDAEPEVTELSYLCQPQHPGVQKVLSSI